MLIAFLTHAISVSVVMEATINDDMQAFYWHPWVVQNQFSPLTKLGNEAFSRSDEGEEIEEVFSECGQQWVTQQANEVLLSSVDTIGIHQHDSEVFLLPWDHNEVDKSGCDSLENANRLLECNPLALWDPNEFREVLLDQEIAEGELGVAEIENSKWVSQLLKSFCKLVGFPF